MVADDLIAERSAHAGSTTCASLESDSRAFFTVPKLDSRSFVIMSSAGTIHHVHFDGSAFHTVISPVDGRKLFLIACPVSDTAPTVPHYQGGDDFILFRGNGVNVYLVVLKVGDYL